MRTDAFHLRHIGPSAAEATTMLHSINAPSMDALIEETLPDDIRLKQPLKLPRALSEQQFLAHMHQTSEKNNVFRSHIGLGYHESYLPAVIQRNILENPGWYTAYTPYQAEISQGRLEALLNFQTMITELTGMELANASLLDESTAAAEAMSMLFALRSREQKKSKVIRFFVSKEVLPQTQSLLQTRATPLGIELVTGSTTDFEPNADFFGALVQYPGKTGILHDYQGFVEKAHAKELKVAFAADPLSLVLLTSPGSLGADVVVGTTQRFGIPLGYGGPHAGYFATRQAYKRMIPGRIIGLTKDGSGKNALRMALQTREQHIKRDKATSNICTAQVLLAVMAGMYAVYHGPKGLHYIATKVHVHACALAKALKNLGFEQQNKVFFDTLHFTGVNANKIRTIAVTQGYNFHYPDTQEVTLSINETTTIDDLEIMLEIFVKSRSTVPDRLPSIELPEPETITEQTSSIIPHTWLRNTPILEHEVFNTYHTETSLMRYIKILERKDLSLTHAMIPLGSCTMKLNAAAEMLPLSDPQWANIHPFAPKNQAGGYHEILSQLEQYLTTITGFAGTSLQPNSGAQGEYAGLMVIRAYHESKGEGHRNICLIPSSAHGTNPASAVMAGMKVIVTKASDNGNIDLDDLRAKAIEHQDALGALMVTYPSTHGVYESAIREITGLIHHYGGQVYMDGANMNAQVGLTHPAAIGADVCHLNLHKTFAIPHGGGGPGVGPICVAEQLLPFLPGNPVIPTGGAQAISAISAAPWGSALACLISYGYIRMLGVQGLTRATKHAILNANYIKNRLDGHFETLYTGERGRAAHELIIDCRPFRTQGIEVSDIAKRLMDYGFHAPTVSFPVAGTLMIEPTESENKAELDRFCDAMINIRKEIQSTLESEGDSVLKNAPHTLELLTADNWPYTYSRQQAAYPLPYVAQNKFWPAVGRIDDAYGDRNLICSCPTTETYQDKAL